MFKVIIAAIVMSSSYVAWAQTDVVVNEETKVGAEYNRADASEYNLEKGIGLKGMDPVSFFQVAEGEKGLKGSEDITVEYGGVTYLFSTEENKLEFLTNPEKFEPTYGGYCAFALLRNQLVDINPKYYSIVGDRIHFFVNKGAKRRYDGRNGSKLVSNGQITDVNWNTRTGELPRNPNYEL